MIDIKLADPKGLIRESYNIENITIGECRTIFFDWAVQVPNDATPADHIRCCLDFYAPQNAPDHPMTSVLTDGLKPSPQAKRRGGRRARVGSA